MMRRLVVVTLLAAALVVVNAIVDSKRTCDCRDDCWCKQPGVRHFRWLFPFQHRT